MSPKEDRYYRGIPQDPSRPLPGEVSARSRRRFRLLIAGVLLFGVGAMVGTSLSGNVDSDTQAQIADLRAQLRDVKAKNDELQRALVYQDQGRGGLGGALSDADRQRHEREGRRYARALRKAKAQAAASLVEWFIGRWNTLLDRPSEDDRVTRRAELLSRLIGGMAQNLNPKDYVPWQAEFLSGEWLGDLHFDMDGDGLPAKRSARNTHDGFTGESLCTIAMALNQTITDVRVLVMPNMVCDRADARISVFLQGDTLDNAVDEFVEAARRHGFIVVEREDKGIRLVLVGAPPRRSDDD